MTLKRNKYFGTIVSPRVWQKLREIAETEGLTVTKVVLRILFEDFDYTTEIRNDYSFSAKTGHKIVAKVTEADQRKLEKLAAKNGVTVCQLVRNILYTHFFGKGKE